ncbi:MAG: ABC transporter permease [Coriobacteriales bacterium]|jgi:ABC-2 type transport system permease protein|nr:ABC transporter permease [Coriobacteriales bacterium]
MSSAADTANTDKKAPPAAPRYDTLASRFKKDWYILSSLVGKDFKRKYRRSVLGVVWSILNPVLQMIVLSVVFSYVFRFQLEGVPFALYLILGQTLFSIMASSSSMGLMSMMEAAPLIKKVRVNKYIFPLSKVLFEFVNFGFSFIAVIAVALYYNFNPAEGWTLVASFNLLSIPLVLIYLAIFCSGLSFLLSALTVFFRDVIHLWSVFVLMWTYATPLFYPLAVLPPEFQPFMKFNPMYQFITYMRDIILYGQVPSLRQNLVCLAMALLTFAIGFLVFRFAQRKFILYV